MGKRFFYLRLAWSNVIRNRQTYLPYLIATAIISGVYLLIAGFIISPSLTNLPSGNMASMIFQMGLAVFAIFAFFFMVYINNFLISRRKREFGLYGILGLERRHIARVLVLENFLVLGGGMLLGILFALVFGQLLFLLLLKLIHAVPGSTFSLAPAAYLTMLGLFAIIFLVTSMGNIYQMRKAKPIELLSSEKRGDKDSKLILPMAIFGILLLGISYYFAWSIDNPAIALGVFFLLALLVIFATYALFSSGSIAVLRGLRANKKIYYKLNNFVSISGMLHRMRQNAKGLATICILSTMLLVTVSFTLALYAGQEKILEQSYPYDVKIEIDEQDADTVKNFETELLALAETHHVTLSAPWDKLTNEPYPNGMTRNNYYTEDSVFIELPHLLYFDGAMRFDVEGEEEDCLAFMADLPNWSQEFSIFGISDVFTARQDGYGMYGGLLFLGVFFGVLFLAVTVLIIYFKQITEGYEDKERFAILQKVGMDDKQVKSTINRQVLWVFFLPLAACLIHMVFASKIIARMLESFLLYDWGLTLSCVGCVSAVFILLYLVVYRLTARVYYKIVKW